MYAGAVARAMAAITKFYRGHTKTKTGIWRDLAVRKRKTEVEAHVGATLARAERHGSGHRRAAGSWRSSASSRRSAGDGLGEPRRARRVEALRLPEPTP